MVLNEQPKLGQSSELPSISLASYDRTGLVPNGRGQELSESHCLLGLRSGRNYLLPSLHNPSGTCRDKAAASLRLVDVDFLVAQ